MRQCRPSPIALNTPHRVFGFDPQGLMGCVIILAFGLMSMTFSLPLGLSVIVFSLFCLGGVYLFGKYKVLIVTLSRALFQKARYEPTRRDVFRLEIR